MPKEKTEPKENQEPPPGMLPDGKLNIVNADDPPYKPRIIGGEEAEEDAEEEE